MCSLGIELTALLLLWSQILCAFCRLRLSVASESPYQLSQRGEASLLTPPRLLASPCIPYSVPVPGAAQQVNELLLSSSIRWLFRKLTSKTSPLTYDMYSRSFMSQSLRICYTAPEGEHIPIRTLSDRRIDALRYCLCPGTMLIDPLSIRDLEVVGTVASHRASGGNLTSLVAALNKTRTPMGYRLLKVGCFYWGNTQRHIRDCGSNASLIGNRQTCYSL